MLKILKIAIPLLVIAGGIYGYKLYNTQRTDIESGAVAFQVTAEELAIDFEENEADANDKYLGQILQVNGEVFELILEEESYGLLLNGGDAGSIYCAFNEPPQVKAGDVVTVKGVCSGYLMDVVINDCMLISEAP